MNYRDRHYWFPARKWGGWGWGVANNWKGLLVQIGIPTFVYAAGRYLLPRHETGLFMAILFASLIVFLALHWIKGEPPTWRW